VPPIPRSDRKRRLNRPLLLPARGHRQALLLFLACCLVGCGDSTSPTPCSATGVGPITASGGLTPTITWAAECAAQEVMVFDLGTGLALWHVTGDTRGIPKPVVYGVAPAGTKILHTAEPLQLGTRYGVYVAILVGTDTLGAIGGLTP
jgi:hypothetical protein